MMSDSNSGAKICLVAPFPPPYGGMSIQAEKLLSRLRQQGEVVSLIPTNPKLPKGLGWAQSIPGLRTFIRLIRYIGLLLKSLQKCDVVHHMAASGVSFYLGTVPVSLIAALYGKRFLMNYRGGKAADFLSHHAVLAVPILRLADELIVPSEFLRDVFLRYGFDAEIIPNIADTDLFRFRARERFSPRLIFTRHLEPMYNPECVIRAFARIQKELPDAALGFVGKGSQEHRLKKMVGDLALRNVIFHGFVQPGELSAIYDQYDVFVNSSLVDNFPGSLVEAACCGLPIVTSRAGGIPAMIRDRETGMLAELNSDEQIAECVTELIRNHELASSLASSARLWAEQYSWSNIYPKLLNVYSGRNESDANLPTERKELTGVSR